MRVHPVLPVLAVLMSGALCAQNSTIEGYVSDASTAPVPGTRISVANVGTGFVQYIQSNAEGYYALPFLPAGMYRVTALKEGFMPLLRDRVRLEGQQVTRVDLRLIVGTVREAVEVHDDTPLLDSTALNMGRVVESKQLSEVPLNGRNYLELARLAGSALPAVTSRTNLGGGFVAAGSQSYQTSILLDGIDNTPVPTGGAQGQIPQAATPSLDAIAEMKIATNNYSAEYGVRMGPVVLVTLKSGTGDYHGSLYEYLRNDKLDGTNFFANRSGSGKPTYRLNQFGASLGGPLLPRRSTFFFVSFEGTRARTGNSYLSTVPRAASRGGDFSQEAIYRSIFDPLTGTGTPLGIRRQPFAGNRIPASRIDPVAAKVVSLFPDANVQGRERDANNYFRSPSSENDNNQIDYSLDQSIASGDRFFVHHSLTRHQSVTPSLLPTSAGSEGGRRLKIPAHNLGISWTRPLGTGMFNHFRFGYLRLRTLRTALIETPMNEWLGIRGAPGDTFEDGGNQGFAHLALTGYASLGTPCCEPNQNDSDILQFYNSVAVNTRRHFVKFGVEYRRTDMLLKIGRFRRGQFVFTGVYTSELPDSPASRIATGNSLADALLGMANRTVAGTLAGYNSIHPFWAGYVQDNWRITPRWTVDFGVRWEFAPPGHFPDGGPEYRMLGVSNYLTEYSGVFPGDPRYGTFERPKNGRDHGGQPALNDFAPRIGIAYRPWDRTVIRVSAGQFYGLVLGNTVFTNQTPDVNEVSTFGTPATPAAQLQTGLPLFPIPAPGPIAGNAVSTAQKKQVRPYVTQWLLELQREVAGSILLSAAYVGSKSTFLGGSVDTNFPGPHPTIPWFQRRKDMRWTAVVTSMPWGNSSFNAMVVKGEKRFARGITFLSSYMWAHNIDNVTQPLDNNFTVRTDPFDWSRDRGNSNMDVRHSVTASVVYALPFGTRREAASRWRSLPGRIFGGWQLSAIMSLRSGLPFDLAFPGDAQNSGTVNRGNRVASGSLASPTIDRWYDESAFMPSEPGIYGNTGRNILTGPGSRLFDVGLSKRFAGWRENHSWQIRAEAFNVANTPQFGQPEATLRLPATASINSAGQPRRVQFGLRYVF